MSKSCYRWQFILQFHQTLIKLSKKQGYTHDFSFYSLNITQKTQSKLRGTVRTS